MFILSGLIDLAMFFNSIMFAHLSYIRDNDDDGSLLWNLANKFIIGKQLHNFYLPWICNDLQDNEMFKTAALNTEHAVCFAMLHEYGHARLNHRKRELDAQNIQQEFDADAMAIELIDNKSLALFMALDFFKLYEVTNYFKAERTHPYCHKRLLNLYSKYEHQMIPEVKKQYEFRIDRTEKIFSGFDLCREKPLKNMYEKAKATVLGVTLQPVPNIADLDDYNDSRTKLYELINKNRS